jgi:hypothetical protein
MRIVIERERTEKENAIQLMLYEVKQKEEQLERERKEKDREIADLRDKLSRAASLTPQVNKYDIYLIQIMLINLVEMSHVLFITVILVFKIDYLRGK